MTALANSTRTTRLVLLRTTRMRSTCLTLTSLWKYPNREAEHGRQDSADLLVVNVWCEGQSSTLSAARIASRSGTLAGLFRAPDHRPVPSKLVGRYGCHNARCVAPPSSAARLAPSNRWTPGSADRSRRAVLDINLPHKNARAL
jgi:hypothetical protein